MTTQATTIGGIGTRPRPSLEELVDRLMAALFRAEPETVMQTATPSVARSVHEARRLRQAGDLDGALAVFAGFILAQQYGSRARRVLCGLGQDFSESRLRLDANDLFCLQIQIHPVH